MLVQFHRRSVNYRELVSNIVKTSKRAGLPTKQYLRRRKPLSLAYGNLLTHRGTEDEDRGSNEPCNKAQAWEISTVVGGK